MGRTLGYEGRLSIIMARYLVDANVTTRSQPGDRMQAWARKTLRDISRTARKMAKFYDI
jgi:hypothetical protein